MQDEIPEINLVDVFLNPGDHIVFRSDGCATCEREILDWCQELIKDTWCYDIDQKFAFKVKREHIFSLKFQFRNPRDATLFKLTWC